MRKMIVAFGFILGTAVSMNAQVDAKAKAILDKVSTKVKGYTSYKVDFSYDLSMPNSSKVESKTGSLIVKGNKYYLNFAGQEVYCDGKNITSYMKANNEASLELVEDQDEEAISPSSILTIHEKGFKQKFIKDDGKLNIIDLYPNEPKKKDFTMVTIYIDKAANDVKKAVIKGRNGSTYTYSVVKLTPNHPVTDANFTFDKSKFPGVKVIK